MKTHTKAIRKTHVTHQLESKNVLHFWSYDVKHVMLLKLEYKSRSQHTSGGACKVKHRSFRRCIHAISKNKVRIVTDNPLKSKKFD